MFSKAFLKVITLVSAIIYLFLNSFYGNRGLISTLDIDRMILIHKQKLTELKNKRESLENKLLMLQHYDPDNLDYLDEIARKKLGLGLKGEIIIPSKKLIEQGSFYNKKP